LKDDVNKTENQELETKGKTTIDNQGDGSTALGTIKHDNPGSIMNTIGQDDITISAS